jgi:hypothetical protein
VPYDLGVGWGSVAKSHGSHIQHTIASHFADPTDTFFHHIVVYIILPILHGFKKQQEEKGYAWSLSLFALGATTVYDLFLFLFFVFDLLNTLGLKDPCYLPFPPFPQVCQPAHPLPTQ